MKAFLETWRPVLGYEGIYEVSDFGDVRSLKFEKVKYMKKAKSSKGYEYLILWSKGKQKLYLVHRLVWEAFRGPIPDGYEIDHINTVRDDNRLANLRCVTPKENNHNPITRERHLESMRKLAESEEWCNNHLESMRKLAESEQWRNNVRDANRRKAKDPKWLKRNLEAARKRSKNPEWIENHREASRKALAKPVLQLDKDTGEVIREWECARDAERELGISNHISACCNGKKKSTGGFRWRFK